MLRISKVFYVTLLVFIMTVSTTYAQSSVAVIWDAPAQWVNNDRNITALEMKLKEFLPSAVYFVQPLASMNEKLSAYRSSHNLLAKSPTEAAPLLSKDAILSLAGGNDYAMVLRMDSIISDVYLIGGIIVPTVVNYYVFNIADIKVYNVKSGKLLYKNKQFMGKGDNSSFASLFKAADSVSQERKDEIFQTAFEKCIQNFTFDASHIHRLEN